jgi:hypothetical protein
VSAQLLTRCLLVPVGWRRRTPAPLEPGSVDATTTGLLTCG